MKPNKTLSNPPGGLMVWIFISFGFMELFWAHRAWQVLAMLYAVLLFSAMAIIMV